MISSGNYRKVQIHITTYTNNNKNRGTMCDDKHKHNPSRFICSICLNNKSLDDKCVNSKRKCKSCPICHRNCDHYTQVNNIDTPDEEINLDVKKSNSKIVQTSQADLTQGLTLLNEVLNVFQTKKVELKDDFRTKKDASVATDIRKSKPELSMSKVFKFSIGERELIRDGTKFIVLNSVQPEIIKSQFTLNLGKMKSSSIPQMKVEELKYSLKEKTKSKDAIEEVNRMFATVKKQDKESLDDTNRPLIRSGPRVLPVVKTKEKFEKNECVANVDRKNSCKCCQTENYYLSCGDSKECCKNCCEGKSPGFLRCDKCVYMLSCHHKRMKMHSGLMICECCKKMNTDCCEHGGVESSEHF